MRASKIAAIGVLVLGFAFAAGCLGPADEETPPSQPQTIEPQEASNTSEGDNETHGTDAEPSTGSEDANGTEDGGGEADEPGPRTVTHAMGETTIEGTTDRVVALEFNHVENLLALGIQPAGVADKEGYEKWVAAGQLGPSVADVGTRAEPSLETIANLEPDLIIAIDFRHEDIYDELSAIGPTLVFQGFPSEEGTDQFERMLSILDRTAQATAHTEEGQAVVEDMRQRFEQTEARLAEADSTGREVLFTQVFTYNGQPLARVFLDASIAANVAERIGLENAWTKGECSTGYGYCDVSKEGFADVQHADFFYQAQPDDDPVQDEWSDDPVWNSYEFVKEDRVYTLGADAWLFGGPLMSQELADRIAENLTG